MKLPFMQKGSIHSVNEALRLRDLCLEFLKSNVASFGHIEPSHILFVKDMKDSLTRHDYYLEIQVPTKQMRMALPEIHYILVAHDSINTLNHEQRARQFYHAFRHIPRNYKELEQPRLLEHDFEEFEDVAVKFKSKELLHQERKIPSFTTQEN